MTQKKKEKWKNLSAYFGNTTLPVLRYSECEVRTEAVLSKSESIVSRLFPIFLAWVSLSVVEYEVRTYGREVVKIVITDTE